MKTENVSTLRIHKLSKEQFLREQSNEALVPGEIYLTPDDGADNLVEIIDWESATHAQVLAAVNAGKAVLLRNANNNVTYYLDRVDDGTARFFRIVQNKIWLYILDSDGMSYTETYVVETTGNKVSAISDESSDDNYPSAKAVYDFVTQYVDDLIGDVESAVAAINTILGGV